MPAKIEPSSPWGFTKDLLKAWLVIGAIILYFQWQHAWHLIFLVLVVAFVIDIIGSILS